MGVKGFWQTLDSHQLGKVKDIVQPTSTDLKVAVDLSGWLLQSKTVSQQTKVQKQHVSNLFYRVKALLQLHICPVFVIDGPAPELKKPELQRRFLQRAKLLPKKTDQGSSQSSQWEDLCSQVFSQHSGDRAYISRETRECCRLLDSLGVKYFQSEGEAEATCSWLNANGVVDAVISDDSDCFLFGAKVVWRNFICRDDKILFTEYKMADIEGKLRLAREDLVAYALLVGCDFSFEGVRGVGPAKALALLETIRQTEESCLKRLREWRSDSTKYDDLAKLEMTKLPVHCTNCNHPGYKSAHVKSGCELCASVRGCHKSTKCSCPGHVQRNRHALHQPELRLRSEALKEAKFPNQDIIDLFLNFHCDSPVAVRWASPDVVSCTVCLSESLDWGSERCAGHMLDISVAYQLYSNSGGVSPSRVLKKRTRHGVAFFEVEWQIKDDPDYYPENLVTLVPCELMQSKYPQLVGAIPQKEPTSKAKNKRIVPADQKTIDQFFTKTKKTYQVSSVSSSKGAPDGSIDLPILIE